MKRICIEPQNRKWGGDLILSVSNKRHSFHINCPLFALGSNVKIIIYNLLFTNITTLFFKFLFMNYY